MRRPSAALLAVLLCAVPGRAAINQWTGTGPEGGSLVSIAVDPAAPTRIFAGGEGGLVRSTNGGASWSNADLPGVCVLPLPVVAIDPRTPSTVYVATGCGRGTEARGRCGAEASRRRSATPARQAAP